MLPEVADIGEHARPVGLGNVSQLLAKLGTANKKAPKILVFYLFDNKGLSALPCSFKRKLLFSKITVFDPMQARWDRVKLWTAVGPISLSNLLC